MLSVIIPAHNEARNLVSLVSEVCAVLTGQGEFEVIVVDDGSSDGTQEILGQLRAVTPRLVIFRHRFRSGQSAALITGVSMARGSIIVTLDGDGQNLPVDIPRLLSVFSAEPGRISMVVGCRQKRHDHIWRRICSRIANSVRSRVLGDAVPDSGCGIKVFSRNEFLQLPRFDHMHRFLQALIRREGGTVQSVAVGHRPREHGRSHYGTLGRLIEGIVDLLGVAWLNRRAPGAILEVPVASSRLATVRSSAGTQLRAG